MGNEMGNNNTSALKDEDNTSEAEKQSLQEKQEHQKISTNTNEDADTKAEGFTSNNTTELGNETWQVDAHTEGAKGEHQKIPTSEAIYVVEKSIEDFIDATTELGKDVDDVKGKIQTTPTAEAEEVQEKTTGLANEDRARTLNNYSLEGDAQAGDMNVENQTHPTAAVEYVQEKNGVPDSESTSVLEKDSSEGNAHAGDVNVENQMHPTAEAKELASNKTISVQIDVLEGDVHADNVNEDRLQHPTAEANRVDGKSAKLAFNDATSELQQDKSQEDIHVNGKGGENAVIPVAETKDMQGKGSSLAYSDPLNVRESFGSAVQEISEIRQTEDSSSAGSVEEGDKICEISISLLEGTEEYDKNNKSRLKKDVLVSYDHNHLDSKSSIKQEELETSDSAGMSIDAEFQELLDTHCHHNELFKVQNEQSLQRSESLQRSDFLDHDLHCPQYQDDDLEKEMENQEKKLCTDKSDGREGDELGSVIKDTSEIKSDSLSVGNKCNGNLLANANYVTNEFLNSLLESVMVDNPLRSDHVKYCTVTNEEGNMSRCGLKMANSHSDNSGKFSDKSMKVFKSDTASMYDLTTGSNGDFNEERYKVHASSVCGISNNDQVPDPKLTENGYQIDVYIKNHKGSDEIITSSEQKTSFVTEAEVDLLITMSGVADCKHEEGEYNKNKIVDEIHKNPEASYAKVNGIEGREKSEKCNSHLVTIDQAESLTPPNSASSLHICNYQQGNVNHSKTSTASTASMLASDLKQAIDNKLFGAKVYNDKHDFSNLTMPAIDLVDDEAFEEEGEDYSQHIETTSSKGAEITSSAATLSIEPGGNNFVLPNGGYEAMESITRLSTESNPDAPNISAQIQKSPSFNLNLRIEARPEESDQIPLLYQEKTEIGSLSNQTRLDFINSTHHAEYGQCMLRQEEMPVEEKVVTVERSYSAESKTQFLGLSKEEEAHLLVTPQKQHDFVTTKKAVKEIESTSPRGKEKRKPRSFFFSSCMCCATAVN